MTRAAIRAIQGEDSTTERHGKHKLDELNASWAAKHLVLFRPTETVVEYLMAKARLSIPGLAATCRCQYRRLSGHKLGRVLVLPGEIDLVQVEALTPGREQGRPIDPGRWRAADSRRLE